MFVKAQRPWLGAVEAVHSLSPELPVPGSSEACLGYFGFRD